LRLPPHVIRRRQGLYLRLRLPLDLARLTGRSHLCQSLRTGDPREARGLAAARVAGLHEAWQEARARVVATFRGKPFKALGPDDIVALRADLPAALAEIEAMPDEDRVRLNGVIKDIIKCLERQSFGLRVDREMAQTMMDYGREALLLGKVRGMAEAIALSAQAGPRQPPDAPRKARQAHSEARAPWPEFIDQFYAARPGMSVSTLASYGQAFREWEGLIGRKLLADLDPRDVGRYAEFLEGKDIVKGNTGKLNRKTVVRLVGHIRTFTEWALGKGLIAEDPGAGITIREQTRVEQKAEVDGAKRAFTKAELTAIFASPIYSGGYSLHYRSKPSSLVVRDTVWWLFITAHLSGARLDELARAPATIADLDGVPCIDLRHASKTLTSPRLVPVFPDLRNLGFLEYAAAQQRAGCRLFEGQGEKGDWSKWCNRYLDAVLGEDPMRTFHSFRHNFRQMCSAAGLSDYLADKLLGHRNGKDRSMGSAYGRLLSPDEAHEVADKIKSPIFLGHLKA